MIGSTINLAETSSNLPHVRGTSVALDAIRLLSSRQFFTNLLCQSDNRVCLCVVRCALCVVRVMYCFHAHRSFVGQKTLDASLRESVT